MVMNKDIANVPMGGKKSYNPAPCVKANNLKIWKYHIPMREFFSLEMPLNATVLAVGVQNNEPVLWASVHLGDGMKAYRFQLVGTGNTFTSEGATYIGTFQLESGNGHRFVGHVFQEAEK